MLQSVYVYVNILVRMKAYNVTIRNLYNSENRVIRVEGIDPMTAHKTAYMKRTTRDEEILTMIDDRERVVFDLRKGFLR